MRRAHRGPLAADGELAGKTPHLMRQPACLRSARRAPEAGVVRAFHNVAAPALRGDDEFPDEDVIVVGDSVGAGRSPSTSRRPYRPPRRRRRTEKLAWGDRSR